MALFRKPPAQPPYPAQLTCHLCKQRPALPHCAIKCAWYRCESKVCAAITGIYWSWEKEAWLVKRVIL